MTDIKFGTDGWRAIIAEDYTTENVARVAQATAKWLLGQSESPSVVVGYDCRFGGEMFADITARILAHNGVKVYVSDNFSSTPMVSLAAFKLKANAGVVITASHNPPSYNGFKVKAGYGGPALPAEIEKIEALLPESAFIPNEKLAAFKSKDLVEVVDLEQMYLDELSEKFDLKAIEEAGIGLAYDAMFGAGQNVIKRLFPNAAHLHCTYNPSFLGQAPEPIGKNLQELESLIKDNPGVYHMGLANDGDADRIGIYDSEGNFIDSHHIILLLIYYLVEYKEMTGKVVVAFSTTGKIRKLCEQYDLPYEVTKVGFKYICGHMVEEDVLLGGEESGGIAVKGHIPERDGVWIGLVLMEFMAKTGKSLIQLIAEVYEKIGAFNYDRDDLHLEEAQKVAIIANCNNGVYERFGKFKVELLEDLDGYKYHLGLDRWLMIRPSGTEPVLRVYAEGRTSDEVKEILSAAHATLLKEEVSVA